MFKIDVGKETVIINNDMAQRLYADEKETFKDELDVIKALNKNSPYPSKFNGLKHENVEYKIEEIDNNSEIHLFDGMTCNHIRFNDTEISFTNFQTNSGNTVTLSKENIYALSQYFKSKEKGA